MTTEERLAKLEREMKEMKALICTKGVVAVKDTEDTVVEGKNLDAPTFKRRNIRIPKGSPSS